jgi:hypothetical protein
LGESGSEIEAEYTITMPNSISNITTHTNGWSYAIIFERWSRLGTGLSRAVTAEKMGSANFMQITSPRDRPISRTASTNTARDAHSS